MQPKVRRAAPEDGPVILSLVAALAGYEKLTPPDPPAQQRLLSDLFGTRPKVECHLGEIDGATVGYAFVFETYSSFLALPTLYLEDLFVLPAYRDRKVGSTLFRAMVGLAHDRGCGRMEWTVLDWNRPAIDFYDRLGARHMKEWLLYRLLREEMADILQKAPLGEKRGA